MRYSQLTIHTDGGSRGNPGPAAVGIVILGEKDQERFLFEHSETIGDQTNNVAEYMGVIIALRLCLQKEFSADTFNFILDSELIVRQITGQYRIKEPHLQQLASEVRHLIDDLKNKQLLGSVNFRHVLRAENKGADRLVNQALDGSMSSRA